MSKEFRYGTKRYMIAELVENGLNRISVFQKLRPMVEQQIPPMVFKRNVKGQGRQPKPLSEQLIELKNEINRVFALLGHADDGSLTADDSEPIADVEIPEEEELEETQEEEEEERKPVASGKVKIKNELEKFLRRVREIRKFCEDRAELSEPIDSISIRPAMAAGQLIPAGIPADALLDSMTMHWPKDVRRDAGISDFDFVSFSLEILAKRGITEVMGKPVHKLFGYALILAECRQPIMLIGPAGTGKSHLARQLADYLEIPYKETPMSPGATRGDLLGRHTVGGFIPAAFPEIYAGGGIFNFEEMDASDSSLLIVLNNALAGNKLYNSANGEEYERSEDFIAVSTANTFGLGANRDYTARERLDAATIDRWRMGRIWIPLDENVEESLLYN